LLAAVQQFIPALLYKSPPRRTVILRPQAASTQAGVF
jgi:hypothetical protein